MKTKQIFYDFWESIIIIGERQLFLLVTTIQPLNLNLSIIKFGFSNLNMISNSNNIANNLSKVSTILWIDLKRESSL